MADGEAVRERSPGPDVNIEIPRLADGLQELGSRLRTDAGEEENPVQAATDYCQRFCQVLLEYAEKWKAPEDSLPLLEVYTVAIESYAEARPYLTSDCENVAVVLERLSLSCVELLLCLPHELPDDHWTRFQYSIQAAYKGLITCGSHELSLLFSISQEVGIWKDPVLQKLLNQEAQDPYDIDRFLLSEGPILLEMRIKRLLKLSKIVPATSLAKLCSDHPEMSKRGHFKQIYLTCLCADSPNIRLIEEIAKVDCKDALDMICNLESDGDEKTSLILCAAFLSRQLQFGEMYCAWELTLFWSKLQRRVDPSIQVYLERCRQLSLLTKTVYHIFFLIKVIQSETEAAGLPTCIELCVRALRLESSENSPKVKISICKTISCLLPDDLEVKRACQLSEFLLEPTVDAYYAVEMLYNQPDQKYDEESLPVPNSLRCELLLVLKTRWPFDPEFWDWKTLKRQCLALMGEEASIVSSIDELNDHEVYDQMDSYHDMTKAASLNGYECFEPSNIMGLVDEKKKKKHIKNLKERGCISERFRNWQAYMQYCVLCDKEFLGHRIVRHAQKHFKDGVYCCPICAKEYNTKESFVPHVTLHVKQSSKERLETMGSTRRLPRLPKKTPACKTKKTVVISKQERAIKKNSLYSDDFIVFNDNDNSDDNDERDNHSDELESDKQVVVDEFPCPVQYCNKGFKYFKNLIAHVRGHKDCEEATRFLEIQSKKVICQYCRRQFVSLTHLNDHLQMHCGAHPYFCIQLKCKGAFDTYAELLTHRKEHRIFRARCMFPKCGRIFSAAYMLFDHEAQHYNTFTCKNNDCGKIYHSQLQLDRHMCDHAGVVGQESYSNTDAELTDQPGTDSINEYVRIKVESLHEDSIDCGFSVASSRSELPMDQMPKMISLKTESFVPAPVEQNMHALDPLPPPADFPATISFNDPALHTTNLRMNHNTVLKTEFVPPSDLQEDPNKLPSFSKEMCDALILNGNKFIDAANTTETPVPVSIGLEDSHLPIQECKMENHSDGTASLNCCEGAMKVDSHIDSVSGKLFKVEIQGPPLCENNLDMPVYEARIKSEEALSLSLESSSLLSNIVPHVVTNTKVTPLPQAPPQRFKCNVEGCPRIYNSVQSIGKHMKTIHPDHYPDFKTERKNRKKIKAGSSQIYEEQTYRILPPADGSSSPSFQSSSVPSAGLGFQSPVKSAIPAFTSSGQSSNPVFQMPGQNTSPTYKFQVQNTDSVFQSTLQNSGSSVHTRGQNTNPNFQHTVQNVCSDFSPTVQNTNPDYQTQVQHASTTFHSPTVQNNSNPVFCNQLQHIPNTVFPAHLETLVNPLLSSVDSIITQDLSKNVTDPLLGPEVGNLTNATLTSQLEDLAKVVLPLKFENGSDPFLPMPTENDPLPVLSSLSGNTIFSQLGSNTDHELSGSEAVNSVFLKEEPDTENSFNKQIDSSDMETSFNLEKSAGMLSSHGENKNVGEKTKTRERRPKSSSRVKCPAIIKDGKFICSRCFRAFSNPRSLGGHLSKRAVCKPHNEYDISHVPAPDNQTSVLTSMMSSDTPKQTLLSPPQTFNPEGSLKEEPFNRTISPEETTTFLQSGFAHPNVPTFLPCIKTEGMIKQEFDAPHTVEQVPYNHHMTSENRVSGNNTLSCSLLAGASTPLIAPMKNKLDSSNMVNTNLNNCESETFFPEEGCLKMDDNELCSNPALNSPENSMSNPVGSARVSVISGPQKSGGTSAKKKSVSSKKRKKNPDAPTTDRASHELVKNILAALSNLPVSIGGSNSQSPVEMQPNLMSYGSELLENIAKHLNSADKQLFLACINESLKANPEAQDSSQPTPQSDNPDTQNLSNCKEQTDFDIQADYEGKPCDHSPLDTNVVFPVNTQHGHSMLPQTQDIINGSIEDIPDATCPDSTSSPVDKMNIPVCSVSPTQDVNHTTVDTEVLEIMDLVQKMQLADDFLPEETATYPDTECHTADSLSHTSSVIVPNPSLGVPHDETDELSKSLVDKGIAKPFICQEDDCSYCAMTKDALFKHYAKVHYYTQEKILEIKKHQLKFAPFRCVIPSCTKTFTRNSNLRAHCQSMHHFTSDQMVKLKIKRPYERKSLSESMASPVQEMSPKMTDVEKCSELQTVPPLILKREPETYLVVLPTSKPLKEEEPDQFCGVPTPNVPIVQNLSPNVKGSRVRKKKKRIEQLTKNMQKDAKPSHVLAPYKPYKCVHQGCTAAFTIQQNLILHYQAVHKSDLSKFSLEEDAKDDGENGLLREFRCMETDCSRIFQEIASLIQHYVNFHEMIAEEIENVVSSFLNSGNFKCDQHQCTSLFTTCAEYIEHLESVHEIRTKQVKSDGDEMYKCDCEGCDRVYATRSNLLRHIFRKHNDKHKEHLLRPKKLSLSDLENPDEKNQKEKPKVPKIKIEVSMREVPKSKRAKGNNLEDFKAGFGQTQPGPLSLKYGRHTYALKPKDVALAECTGSSAKQYPCMIRGCKSIVTSEFNINRHYKCHKLSKAFIIKHRKALVVCKRRIRTKALDCPKIDPAESTPRPKVEQKVVPVQEEAIPNLNESSDESTISVSQPSETEKDEMDELAELFIAKLSNEDSTGSESQARTLPTASNDSLETNTYLSELDRDASYLKRPNKQNHSTPNKKSKLDDSEETLSAKSDCGASDEEAVADELTTEEPPAFDMGSFKPMGFELSFLKFIEESVAKEKTPEELAEHRTDIQLAEEKLEFSGEEECPWDTTGSDAYLLFANPSCFADFGNIKIIIDQRFTDYVDLILKQLNELKPVVVLKRQVISWDDSESVAKEQNVDIDEHSEV